MSGYVEAGYVIVLGSISAYAVSLVAREKAAQRRLGDAARAADGHRSGLDGAPDDE